MKKVIIDSRAPTQIFDSLTNLGFEIISLPTFSALPEPVSAHADMLIFITENEVFCHKDYYDIAKSKIDAICDCGYSLALSDEYISCKYPHDILFNAVSLNGDIYGKSEYISRLIKDKKRVININQGYAKCSTCKVSKNAIISSDPSIRDAALANGIDVLFICEGHIDLPGYNIGFIGGCSGVCGDKIYFSGNISLHPNGREISEFCKKHKKEPISLSREKLFDVGSMFFI